MEVLESGTGDVKLSDPDEVRAWMRDKKSRALIDKVMTEQDAVNKFVHDGYYLSYDLSSMVRGPSSLEREIVRQKKKNLWLALKFTLLDSTILVAGGCVEKMDIGFAGLGRPLFTAIEQGRVKTIDWSNGSLALRHLAGAMGVPFVPSRALMGTDTFKHCGAKVVIDPFTGKRICLVPAINPDVALIHVNQCDKYGNSRVFGPSVSPLETAMASKYVIISTEEIIEHDEIRKNPGKTTIPHFLVNAVVHAPFGSHPGTVPGLYAYDTEHLDEFFAAKDDRKMNEYLEKYIYSVKNNDEYLDKIGRAKLEILKRNETIKEGYY
jgi:glutaconate CoA-transferase subunit A